MDDMLNDYNRVVMINLVKQNKTGECKLKDAFSE